MEYTLASKHSRSELKKQRCPECGSTNLVYDFNVGEVTCSDCGLVLHEILDRGPEWRSLDDEKKRKRTRVGAPSTYRIHDKGLSTTIDKQNRDAYGKPIPFTIKDDIYRLRKWQSRTCVANAKERNIALALAEIFKLCNHLSLPEYVVETASVAYQKLAKQGSIRGRSINNFTASVVYFACRQCGITRTLKEIAKISGTSKTQVGKGYKFILKELGYQSPLSRPEFYVSKILNPLGIKGKTEETVYKILKVAREVRLTAGKGPDGLAAAACYTASVLTGERATQRNIAELIGCTEVTIRNRYKEMMKKLLFEVYI